MKFQELRQIIVSTFIMLCQIDATYELDKTVGPALKGDWSVKCGFDIALPGTSKANGQMSFSITADFEYPEDVTTYMPNKDHMVLKKNDCFCKTK